MGIIRVKERRVSPEIPTTPAAAAAAAEDWVSKEESFQDSRPYLASDSEDDYYSVKGTPSSRPGTPHTKIMCLNNVYCHSMLERRKLHTTTTRARTIVSLEPPPRDQKPLIDFFTDPYWNEQISTDGDISGATHPTTAKQMRLVEFLQDSFWKKDFLLTPSPSPHSAAVVASLKSGGNRVQTDGSSKAANDDHDHGQRHCSGCCFPWFWSDKRKTKVAP